MSQQPLPPLDYATPRRPDPPDAARRSQRWLVMAVAVVAGFVGANPFADAAGFPIVDDPNRSPGYLVLRIFCGVVVALVTMAVVAFVIRQTKNVIALLGGTAAKPAQAVTLTLIICGTACILAAVGIQLYFARLSTGLSLQAFGPGFAAERVSLRIQPPVTAQLVTLLSFLAGAALIGIGVWSSIGRGVAQGQSAPVPAPGGAGTPVTGG